MTSQNKQEKKEILHCIDNPQARQSRAKTPLSLFNIRTRTNSPSLMDFYRAALCARERSRKDRSSHAAVCHFEGKTKTSKRRGGKKTL